MSILKKISVIIVTYNSNETIFHLLDSLKLIDKCIDEIIIIDNNSINFQTKKVQRKQKNIKIIKNKVNIGFGAAVNQGIKISKSNFILLLNPDTYFEDDSVIKTIKKIEADPKIGAIGGKIFGKNNETRYSATNEMNFLTGIFEFTILKRLFPKNKYSKKFWIESSKKIQKPIEVSSLCGAYMVIRKYIGNKLNMFDEKFFLYFEDIDIGYSIKQKKLKVIFDPDSHIRHIGGVSSNNRYHTDLKNWYRSRDIFFKKHQNKFNAIILLVVFFIEKNLLEAISFLKHGHPSQSYLSSSSNPQRVKKSRRKL